MGRRKVKSFLQCALICSIVIIQNGGLISSKNKTNTRRAGTHGARPHSAHLGRGRLLCTNTPAGGDVALDSNISAGPIQFSSEGFSRVCK